MKTFITLFAGLLIICMVQNSMGQISGTAHDFSSESWNTTGRICIVCHTPHHADVTVSDAPLWNHQITTQTFTLYSSSTLDATLGQPDGNSKLCLSCHDGVTAIDNFGGTTTGTQVITGSGNIGTNLNNDHPISFLYDAALATSDGELYDPTTTSSGLGGTIAGDMLFANKMQCGSCHDVHNAANIAFLLVKSNAASALCLTCHDK
ncbi:cytochrome c3 family protein [candidate division KSB1 bacterium]